MNGYVAMSRAWQDHSLFAGDEFSRRDAWAWLIANAMWKPARVRTQNGYVIIQRGELCYSVRFMAKKWLWSKSRVARFLQLLRIEGMIEARPSTGTAAGQLPTHLAGQGAGQAETIITICNYDKFQTAQPTERDRVRDTERDRVQSKSGTKKNQETNKPVVGRENVSPQKQRATMLPEGWKPPPIEDLPPIAQKLARQWPAGAYESQVEAFGCHFRGKGVPMLNWNLTFANWIRRADEGVMRRAKTEEPKWKGVMAGARL